MKRGRFSLSPELALTLLALAPSAAYGAPGWLTTLDSTLHPGALPPAMPAPPALPFLAAPEGEPPFVLPRTPVGGEPNESQSASDLTVDWREDPGTGARQFEGLRWENRYRLFPHEMPLHPMLFVSYEDAAPCRYDFELAGWKLGAPDPDLPVLRDHVLEGRIVLSGDVGPASFSFNALSATNLDGGATAFGYAAGIRWTVPPFVWKHAFRPKEPGSGGDVDAPRQTSAGQTTAGAEESGSLVLGLELFGVVGDSKSELQPLKQEQYVAPTITCLIAPDWVLTGQVAVDVTEAFALSSRINVTWEP